MADKYPIILNKLHDGVSVLQYCDRKDKGSLEDYFAGFFNYNGNIKIDRNRKIFIGNNLIIPDYLIIHNESKKRLIVEIDEPYTLDEDGILIPIHVKNTDDYKNKLLVNHGFSVIRFAEEQIALYPRECVNLINSFINESKLLHVKEVECWSAERATIMIAEESRNEYLPFPFKGKYKIQNLPSFQGVFIVNSFYRTEIKYNLEYRIVYHHNINGGGAYETWIPNHIFENYLRTTEIYHEIKKFNILGDPLYFIINIFRFYSKFEGFGTMVNNKFFNLSDYSNFKIIFRDDWKEFLYSVIDKINKRIEDNKKIEEEKMLTNPITVSRRKNKHYRKT